MRFIASIVLALLLNSAFGQSTHSLQITASDKPNQFFTKKFSYKNHVKDSVQAKDDAKELFNKLRSFGYMGASIDSSVSDTAATHIYMYVGEKMEKISLKNGNVDPVLQANAGVKGALTSGKTIPVEGAEIIKGKILAECENNGYPFAAVKLDSFTQQGNTFAARVYLDKHDLVTYDSLQIFGKTKTKKVFLRNYLGIKIGKPYNESAIRKIQQRISELQFVEAIQPHTVSFLNGRAKVNLYLKDKKSSQFDFLIGLLPGASGKKLLITVEARIHLFSLFGMGEEFFLQWKAPQPKTQQLDVRFVYPYLIGLPLGINEIGRASCRERV